jgi:hypothetical protein
MKKLVALGRGSPRLPRYHASGYRSVAVDTVSHFVMLSFAIDQER